jgi:hypothetical protein
MILNDPVVEFFAWLLFSLVLIWALWRGLPKSPQGLEHTSDGSEDVQFFPDEVSGEPGRGMSVASQCEIGSRDERSHHQANDQGDGQSSCTTTPPAKAE